MVADRAAAASELNSGLRHSFTSGLHNQLLCELQNLYNAVSDMYAEIQQAATEGPRPDGEGNNRETPPLEHGRKLADTL